MVVSFQALHQALANERCVATSSPRHRRSSLFDQSPSCDVTDTGIQLSGLSIVGGIIGFTTVGSLPSLLGGVGVGSLLALSALRIKDQEAYGNEAAAGKSRYW
jgi:hypothetical protein